MSISCLTLAFACRGLVSCVVFYWLASHVQVHAVLPLLKRSVALQESDFLRKSDIVGAARAGGIPFEEKVYHKIMKELCTSKGGQWTIKKRAE